MTRSKSGPCKTVSHFKPVELTPEQQAQNAEYATFVRKLQRDRKDLWYATHSRYRRQKRSLA